MTLFRIGFLYSNLKRKKKSSNRYELICNKNKIKYMGFHIKWKPLFF